MAVKPRRRTSAQSAPSLAKWTKAFLAELAITSNVTASAKAAGIGTSRAYELRRNDHEFNRKWMASLCEGYDHLEMELLHRLRTGEIKPASGAKKGVRTFENATAFRLLIAHRDSAARQRAIRDNQDTEVILASIDDKLERMRRRELAAAEQEDYGEEQTTQDQLGKDQPGAALAAEQANQGAVGATARAE
jgi:hypothetical protein